MLSISLAALSALIWGTADFCGGKASQRASALTVTVAAKVLSLPVLGLFLLLFPARPQLTSLAWAAVGGPLGIYGLIAFYRALAMGAMAIAAPISAVLTALVPMVFGLLTDRLPEPAALIGAGIAIIAILLVSLAPGDHAGAVNGRMLGLAVLAGCCFGTFFVLLERAGAAAGDDAGMWPIAAAQLTAIGFGLLLMARVRTRPTLAPRTVRLAVATGCLDLTANALYLLAVQDGLLSVVAPLAAMYPASTVVLALLIDRERLRPVQLAGLGLAATALVLVAS